MPSGKSRRVAFLGFLRLHHAARPLADEVLKPDAVDQVDRVDHIALGLALLLTLGIADQARDVHVTKRHIARELEPEHDHAGDPEEDDVEAGDQHIGGIEVGHLRRRVGPAQGGKRPQGGGEPGVEHVVVLAQIGREAVGVGLGVRLGPGGARLGLVAAHPDAAVLVVPGRDAVAPPQLAADAPVLDVAHPLEIGVLPVVGHEADVAIFDSLDRRLGQGLGLHEPLVGQVGLQHLAGAVASRHHQGVVVDALQQAGGFEVGDDLLAGVVAVEAAVGGRCLIIDGRVIGQDVDQRQAVPLAHVVVVEVMRGRDLHATGAEFGVHVVVGDYRNFAVGER